MDPSQLIRYSPDIYDLLLIFPISFVYSMAIAHLSSILKSRFNLKTNYSRKIFHFTIFTTAFIMAIIFPIHRIAAFGAGAGGFIILLIFSKNKSYLKDIYNALAREQDEPNRSYYLIIPFIATALGGLATGVLFPVLYPVGYLVAGWGDAAGEPVGVRFGKHKYKVPTFSSTKCTRSIEGSIGVFSVSYIAALIVLFFLGYAANSFILAFGAAVLTTIVEAVSPHGWDNFTTQIAGCIGASIFLLI